MIIIMIIIFFSLFLYVRQRHASKHPAARLCVRLSSPGLRCDGITAVNTRSCGEEGARRAAMDDVRTQACGSRKKRPLLETRVASAHTTDSLDVECSDEGGRLGGWGGHSGPP